MKSNEFKSATKLLLEVQMSNGKGKLAWQHTQLFRTGLKESNNNSDECQFRWIIHLQKGDTIIHNPSESKEVKINMPFDSYEESIELSSSPVQDMVKRTTKKKIIHPRPETTQAFTITPNEAEINDLKIEITYDANKDNYIRKTSTSEDVYPHWGSLTLANDNVFRKEEYDWRMVYLARKEGGKDGFLSWELDLDQHNVLVDLVELYVTSKCHGYSSVIWRIRSDTNKVLLPPTCKTFLQPNQIQQ